VATGTGYTVY